MSFIPLSALERCVLCHDLHALRKVHFNGRQFLCAKCREEEPKKDRNFFTEPENPLHVQSCNVGA